MGRALAKPIQYGLLFLGCLAVVVLSLFVLFQANITKTEPIETGEIVTGVSAIKGGMVNVFLISDGKSTVAVDSGDNAAVIEAGLQKLNVDPKSISAVLLTHSDYDHTAGIKLFSKAKIYMSADEEAMINGKIPRMFGFVKNQFNLPFIPLHDGETINIGQMKIKAISTSGHTYGSMSYIMNDQYLFTGDVIALKNRKAKLFRCFNYSDVLGRKSISKVAKLQGIALLCTAHNGYTKDFKKAMRGW